MIALYRHANCTECDLLQERLEELVLAHRIEHIEVHTARTAPMLEDDGDRIVGRRSIEAHLEKLRAFREEWQRFQTDVCYFDEECRFE